MITSDTPPEVLARLRHWCGPNPKGSKLTNNERLHLIAMLGVVRKQELNEATLWAASSVHDQLIKRGMSTEELQLLTSDPHASATDLADRIAVHPSLKSIADTYLD